MGTEVFCSRWHPCSHSQRLFVGCGGQWGDSDRSPPHKALPVAVYRVCRARWVLFGACTARSPSRRSPGAFSGGRSRGAGMGGCSRRHPSSHSRRLFAGCGGQLAGSFLVAFAPREAPRVGLPAHHRQAAVVGRGDRDSLPSCSGGSLSERPHAKSGGKVVTAWAIYLTFVADVKKNARKVPLTFTPPWFTLR